MKIRLLIIALSVALFGMINSHASSLQVIKKDGLVEMDCILSAPKIPIENATVDCSLYNITLIKKDGKEGLLDKDGNLIVEIEYDDIDFFIEHDNNYVINQDILKVSKANKYGLMNAKTGKLLTPIHFDEMGILGQNRINVKQGNNQGYIDSTGKIAIDLKYGSAFSFENGLAIVSNHGYVKDNTYRMGVIDLMGNEILPPIYRSVSISDDRIIFENESGIDGITDLKGNIIIEPQYTNIGGFYEGYSMVSLMGIHDMVGYIDKNGKEIIEPQYTDFAEHFKIDNKIHFTVAKDIGIDTKWGVVDKDNRTIIDFKYSHIRPQSRDNLFIATDENFKQFLLDEKGKVISKSYDEIIGFTHGMSKYRIKSKYGLINTKGNPITPVIYDDIKHEYNHDNKVFYGYKVQQADKVGFSNKQGQTILPVIYDDIMNFGTNILYIKQEGLYGIATLQGKIVAYPQFDDFRPLWDGYTKAKKAGTWYLLDPQGKNLGKTSAPEY